MGLPYVCGPFLGLTTYKPYGMNKMPQKGIKPLTSMVIINQNINHLNIASHDDK
jgi:hypothetical protein